MCSGVSERAMLGGVNRKIINFFAQNRREED